MAVGGANPIVINGGSGTIGGLTNTTVNYAGFGTGGRAATEEQLKPMSDFIGLNDDGSFTFNGEKHASLQDALNSMGWNVEAPAAGNTGGTGGSGGAGSGGAGGGTGGGVASGTPIHNGDTVGFVPGPDGNIVISKTDRADGKGADVTVGLAKDITVDSVTAKNVKADTVNAGKVNAKEVAIENGPTINQSGIDMGGKVISNVGEGKAPTDAVNLGQLQTATGNLQNQINGIQNQVNRINNDLSAGVAAAMATAALPQAYMPGKSMVSIAAGAFNGQSGLALGISTVSDNGRWVLKVSGNTYSRGHYGGAAGVGFQW